MKNYDETINSVFERINKYKVEKKNKRKIVTRTVTSLCCFCLVALLGVGVWQSGLFQSMPPKTLENSAIDGVQDSSKNPEVNIGDEYIMDTIYIKSLSQGNMEEFAADMYRPDGYNENIGSVLAIKMHMFSTSDYAFPVIIQIDHRDDLTQIITNANNTLNVPINLEEMKMVSITNEKNTTDKYFHLLTQTQIVTLAESGIRCYYVGSGKGEYKDMSWDTESGVNTYCELYGDMYINDNSVKHSPDISID